MKFRDFHPNVRLRIVMSFLTNTLSNMVTPFMAVYFAKTLGVTAAGTITVASIVLGLACATLGGHFADKAGRKTLMIVSEMICAAAYLTMALMNSPWMHSASVTMLMSMLVSAGWGLSKPAVEAMLIDVSTKETRKHMYRITYWSNNLSISIAGMIGAFLFSDYLFELFLAVCVMSVVSLTVTALFLAETKPEAHKGEEEPADGENVSIWLRYRNVLSDKTFMVYILASVLSVSVEMNLQNYIGIRLSHEMRGTPWFPGMESTVDGIHMLGYLRTENTLAVVILSLFLVRMLKLKSDTKTMLAAMAINIIGYTYLAFGNEPGLLILLMLIATIGELVYVPIKQAYLVNLVPDDSRSSYMAVSGMVNRIGQMLCGLNVIIGGFLSPGGMAAVICITGMSGVVMLALLTPRLQSSRQAGRIGGAVSKA